MASSSDASSSDNGGHQEGVYYHKKFKLMSCMSEPAEYEAAATVLRPQLSAATGWEARRQLGGPEPPPPAEPPPPNVTNEAALKAARKAGKYQCNFCGNFFAKPSVLDKHIRSHTNERPFSCAVCKYSFKTKSNFVKHCKTRKHAARSAGGDGGDLPSDEEVTDSEASEPDGDVPSETDSWTALDLAAPPAASRWSAATEPPSSAERGESASGGPASRLHISHSIDHIIGRSEEAGSPPEPPGSPGAKGVVSHIEKVIQLNEAQLSITKRALDNFGRHSTTLGRERETVRRVTSVDPPAAGRRSSLFLSRQAAPELTPPPALARRSSVIGVEAQHDTAPRPTERPRHPPTLLRSSFSVPGAAEEPPVPSDNLQFTAMPALLEARCVGCGLSHPGPCPLLSDGGGGAAAGAGGHILKRHLLSSAAGSPQLKRRRVSSELERLSTAAAARYDPLVPPAAAALPPGGRSPFEERKSLSYMGGGQVMVNEPSERRTYRVNQSVSGTSAGVSFYVSSPPASAAPRETSPQVMTIKSNLNSGGKMIEMSGSSDSGSGGSQLGTPRLTGSAPPLQHNPFHFNKPISSMFTGSFYPAIQAPNITPQLGPIMLPPSPSRAGPGGGGGREGGGREGRDGGGKRFCSPKSPSSGLLSVPGQPSHTPVVALPSASRGSGKHLKLTIQIPRPNFPVPSTSAQTAPVTVPAHVPTFTPAPAAAPAAPVPAPAPAPAPRSPAILQPPISPAPRRSPSRPVPHVPGMPGPYSAASDVPSRIERPPPPPPPPPPLPPPPPPARPPPKIQVQAADGSEAAPSKSGGGLPRPNSLPLQPVQYVNKSQRGAALYSPETPRPRKAIQQTHMNGKCYTYIGHKSSTKLYFCSLFQPQPNYVEQKCGHQVSMYSQWKHAETPADGVPVTRALTTLRLSVNRGSGGRLTFASPELGRTEPRLATAGQPQPRLCLGLPVEQEAGQQRSGRCSCPRAGALSSAACVNCSDRGDPASSEQRARYPTGGGTASSQARRLAPDLPVRAVRNGRPPSWGSSWDSAGDDRHSTSSPRHRRLSTSSGAAEEPATFRGPVCPQPEEQDGPIDLSVGGGRQSAPAPAPAPRRSAADILRPLPAPEQLALMYAVLARLDVGQEERPASLRLPPAGQRYTLELELSSKQRRLSTEPAAAAVTATAASRPSPEVKEEVMSPSPLPPPQQLASQPTQENCWSPPVVEEMAEENLLHTPPPRASSPAATANVCSDSELEIDVVSPGEEAAEAPRPAPPAPADGSTPSTGGMQAILKDIFNQVRHERASAGFAPTRPDSAASAASGVAEPAVSAPSLMHPNVTAGQPGLALTRPIQRSDPADPHHSDSSFFNRNSDRLVCAVCHKRDFVNRNQLSAHTKTHQMDQRRFRCDVCEVSFRSEQQLNKHRKSNDHLQKANIHRQFGKPQGDRRIYECLFCMRGFHNIGTLHKHFRCKTHIMGLENAGWLPCGTYAELEALGVPGRTDGADSINVEGTWPNYCHLQDLSLTLLRDRHAEMADWRRKFDDIRRGRPPRSYPFEIDPKLRGNADPSRPRPQFPADFFRAPPANGATESTNPASQFTYRPSGAAGGGGGGAPLKQEQVDDEPTEALQLNGQSY